MLDVTNAIRAINAGIGHFGFVPRDADMNDFHHPSEPSLKGLRFKTGTVYGEVSVQIVRYNQVNSNETIRVLTERQVEQAIIQIGQVCRAFQKEPQP